LRLIEHIPIEKHKELFKKIQTLIKPDGFIFVHIPNPYYLEWCHKNTPEVLQIIDQPIYTNVLCENLYCNNLYIHTLTTYSIWIDNDDYQAILIKPKVNLEYKEIIPTQSTSQRVKGKIKRIFKK
jgi:2-polyprenyl-3-methyl-5-hydroxy-6-metoxy-1,4-benzoquinol methylase